MKIYVSEKEIYGNALNYVEDDFVEEYCLIKGSHEGHGFKAHGGVDLVEIQSLEQHDEELLKEFALELINWSLPKYGEDIQIQVANDFETKIRKMLKERGIE